MSNPTFIHLILSCGRQITKPAVGWISKSRPVQTLDDQLFPPKINQLAYCTQQHLHIGEGLPEISFLQIRLALDLDYNSIIDQQIQNKHADLLSFKDVRNPAIRLNGNVAQGQFPGQSADTQALVIFVQRFQVSINLVGGSADGSG